MLSVLHAWNAQKEKKKQKQKSEANTTGLSFPFLSFLFPIPFHSVQSEYYFSAHVSIPSQPPLLPLLPLSHSRRRTQTQTQNPPTSTTAPPVQALQKPFSPVPSPRGGLCVRVVSPLQSSPVGRCKQDAGQRRGGLRATLFPRPGQLRSRSWCSKASV